MSAKTLSLIGKVIGVLVILVGHILMWIQVLSNADSQSIIACGFSIMGIFGTVDINIMLDKICNRQV